MKELPDCQFYCLSFNNEERKNTMIRRFNNFDVDCKFYDGVRHDDKRIIDKNLSECLLREWSCCYGHLDMIYNFYYKTNKKYGIFCEDDIHIHKDLIEIMPKILLDFNILNLDILLLGYLTPFKVNEMIDIGYSLKRKTNIKPIYSYHNYPDKLTGTHMYVLSRKHAKVLLDKYYENYADNNKTIFISDIVITKEGNRALISPVLAVEENQSYKKNDLHNSCHKAHFKSDKFI
jgi:GR25 family glycosyltransferase involved in LPS biosynthesis